MNYYADLPKSVRGDHQALVAAMARRFGRHRSLEQVRAKLQRLRQRSDQSLEDLAQEVRALSYALLAKVDPDFQKEECIRYFMGAIRDEYLASHLRTLYLAGDSSLSMEEVVEKAVALKETLGSAKGNTAVRQVKREDGFDRQVLGSAPPFREGLPFHSRPVSGQAQVYRPNYRPKGSHRPSVPTTDRPCFVCDQPGHWHRECPLKAQIKAQVGSTPYLAPLAPPPQHSVPADVPVPRTTIAGQTQITLGPTHPKVHNAQKRSRPTSTGRRVNRDRRSGRSRQVSRSPSNDRSNGYKTDCEAEERRAHSDDTQVGWSSPPTSRQSQP